MKIPEHYGRVGAIVFDAEAQAGAVWLAHGEKTILYDSAVFGDMPMERIAEALKARGPHPIAWETSNKRIAEQLLYGGVNMVPEADAVREDDAMAAMGSRDLADRLQQGLFAAGEREGAWRREYEQWRRSGAAVATTPLLRATRLALASLDYARPRSPSGRSGQNHPGIQVV